MGKDQLHRALDVCIQSIQAGQDLDRVLEMYPKWRSELAPLIRSAYLANQLGQSINMPQDEFEKERQRFNQASQLVIPKIHGLSSSAHLQRPVFLFILAVILLLMVAGVFVLSNHALPGSLFYGVKEFRRDLQLSSIMDSQEYIHKSLLFDQERLQEIQSLAQLGRVAPVNFGGHIFQGEDDDWQINNLTLTTNSETQLVGDIWPGYYVRVEGSLLADGKILAKRIQIQQFLVRGIVESLTSERLVVGGMEILLTPDTLLQGEIGIGARVDILTLLAGENLYRARLIKVIRSDVGTP